MKQILEDIRTGTFRQSYLLYGPEAYLRSQYRDKLRDALVNEGDTFNYTIYRGKNINIGEVVDLAETLPFLAERRVILIEGSGLFKKGGEQFAEYLASPAPDVCFLFAEEEVDKRSRLFKTVKDKGTAVEFPVQDEETLKKWILGRIRREGKTVSASSLEYFIQKTGSDMENISREMEKLFCYTMKKTGIETEDVDAVCTQQVTGQIFEMTAAISERRQKDALRLYYDLLALKEPAMRILFLIGRQFNLLLQVRELKTKGLDNRTIGEKTGLHGFIAGKYAAQAAKFSVQELREALQACVEADESVKTGKMNDTLAVELLLVKYSSAQFGQTAVGRKQKKGVTAG